MNGTQRAEPKMRTRSGEQAENVKVAFRSTCLHLHGSINENHEMIPQEEQSKHMAARVSPPDASTGMRKDRKVNARAIELGGRGKASPSFQIFEFENPERPQSQGNENEQEEAKRQSS